MASASCASVRAPQWSGGAWSGQDGTKLEAQVRYSSAQLPEGWLHNSLRRDASGSFAYRKRSGTYDYSERGYFFVDPLWRQDREFVGLLNAGGVLCVANPERLSMESEDAESNL